MCDSGRVNECVRAWASVCACMRACVSARLRGCVSAFVASEPVSPSERVVGSYPQFTGVCCEMIGEQPEAA